MPQKRAAYKEIRKSGKRRKRNTKITSELRSLEKKFESLLSDKKSGPAKDLLKAISSRMGKAQVKGVIRKNTASRKISRLSKRLHKATRTA